jgi:hypothetical protein
VYDYTKMPCVINPMLKRGVVWLWNGPTPYIETDSVETLQIFLKAQPPPPPPKLKRKKVWTDEEFLKAVGITIA